jgi:glycosyltransferase involved in cell wall biosynthesis
VNSSNNKNTFRIGMIAPCPFPSGQGSQVLIKGYHQAVDALGFHATLFTYHYGEAVPPYGGSIERIPSIPWYRKMRAGPSPVKIFLDLLLFLKVLRQCRAKRIDLLHSHNYEGLVIGLLVKMFTGVPIVYHCHNLLGAELHTYFRGRLTRGIAKALGEWFDRKYPRRADHIIAITESLEHFFVDLSISHRKITVLPPCLTEDDIKILDDIEAGLRSNAVKEYKNGTGHPETTVSLSVVKKRVIYFGNLDAYQDLDILLGAFSYLLERRKDVELLIVTDSNPFDFKRQPSAQLLGDHLTVVFSNSYHLGMRLLCSSHIAVSPRISPYGYPMKILNYMAAAKPVVIPEGSSSYGLRSGVNVCRAGGSQPEDLARAIESLVENENIADAIGKRGKSHVMKERIWSHHSEKIRSMYMKFYDSSSFSFKKNPQTV